MTGLVWSATLAAVGIVGLVLAGSRRRSGWAVGLAAQALWVVYAVTTGQYGFLASAAAYGFVYGRNWWLWRHPAAASASASQRRPPPSRA